MAMLTRNDLIVKNDAGALDIVFSGIRVRPVSRDSIEVSWELSKFGEDWDDIGWLLERSEVQHDGFAPVSPIITNSRMYLDNPVDQLHSTRWWYYRVVAVCVNQDSDRYLWSVESTSQIAAAQAREDIFRASGCNKSLPACAGGSPGNPYVDPRIAQADKIRRFYQKSRSGYTQECTVYHKKTVGDRCKDCWDFILKRVKRHNCPNCKGTGYRGGYYRPIGPVYIKFEDLSKEQAYNIWKTEANFGMTQIRIPNFPHVRPRDLVVENASGRCWVVEPPVNYAGGDVVVQQLAIVSSIESDDIRQDLPAIRAVIPTTAVIGGFPAEAILRAPYMEIVKTELAKADIDKGVY